MHFNASQLTPHCTPLTARCISMQFKRVNNQERLQCKRSAVFRHAHAQLFATSFTWFSVLLRCLCQEVSFSHFLSPLPLPFLCLWSSPLLFFSVTGSCSFLACVGANGWIVPGCASHGGVIQPRGWERWKPLDTPGTRPPFSVAVVDPVQVQENAPNLSCVHAWTLYATVSCPNNMINLPPVKLSLGWNLSMLLAQLRQRIEWSRADRSCYRSVASCYGKASTKSER